MLLTLTARSLAARLNARGPSALQMSGVPKVVFQQTGLRGLMLDTALLKGWGLDDLDTLRMQADQAGCPCLLLRESSAVSSGFPQGATFDKALQRIDLVSRAANRLGCNALALQPECRSDKADEREFDLQTAFFRRVVERVDRLELNVLLEPTTGWLSEPEWLIELVKKVGGFRIGTLPSFEAACRTSDCALALRQTAPYAGAVLGSFDDRDVDLDLIAELDEAEAEAQAEAAAEPEEIEPPAKKKKKKTTRKRKSAKAEPEAPSCLEDCIGALKAVGFEQILALDYLGAGDPITAANAVRRRIEMMLEVA